MRISTNMSLNSFVHHQQSLNSELNRVQQEIITLKAINRPSDNPLEAARLLSFGRTVKHGEQVLENLRFARDYVNEADVALDDVTAQLDRVKELTLGVISSVTIPAEREAALVEIDRIAESLMRVANRTYLDMHLFGGEGLDTPPVERSHGGVTFVGSTATLQGRLTLGNDEAFGVTADQVFGMLSARVQGRPLQPAVTPSTRLDELGGAVGAGIRLDVLRLVEDGTVGFGVDLRGSSTMGEVLDRINGAASAAGASVTAAIADGGLGLVLNASGAVRVSAIDNGTAAVDLGLITNSATPDPIVGAALNRRLTPTTVLEDLFGGTGIDTSTTLELTNGAASATVDLSSAADIQDVLQLIEASGLGVRAAISPDGRGIALVNGVSGTTLTVRDSADGSLADVLGLRTLSPETALAELNFGRGVDRNDGQNDLAIHTRGGTVVEVDIDEAVTLQDVVDLINAAAAEATVAVTAEVRPDGQGLQLSDNTSGSGVFEVRPVGDSPAVEHLGLADPTVSDDDALIGRDVGGVRVGGVFNMIEELRLAIAAGDERAITLAGADIDGHITRVARVRGEMGAHVRDYETRIDDTQALTDSTAALVAEVEGVSLEEALTRFQAVQNALQASLVAGGQSLNLSLMDFLA